nr:copper resistance protein CopC [Planosporangium thailandense]
MAVLAGPAAPASAHAALLQTDPQSGAVLPTAPAEAVLTFSEPVRIVPNKIHIIGPDGRTVDGGAPRTEGPRLHIPMKQTTTRGTYLISYRVISADSHPVFGAIPFSIGAPSQSPPTVGAGGTRTDPLVEWLLGAARYIGYAGLILVTGPALILTVLWPRRLSRRRPLQMIKIGAGLVVLSSLAEEYLEAPYHAGTGLFGASATDLSDVFNSQYGAAHLVRIGVVAALLVLLPVFVNRPAGAGGSAGWTDRTLVGLLAVVGFATWPISGHPAATSVPVVTTVADAAHLGAMAVWIGGLITLFGFLLRRANARELTAILPVWSRWAMTAVTVLVVAGVVQALVSLGSPRGLYGTTYGRLLLGKVGVVALVLAVAWYSRRLTLRPLRESDESRTAEPGGEAVLAAVGLAEAGARTGRSPALVALSPAGGSGDGVETDGDEVGGDEVGGDDEDGDGVETDDDEVGGDRDGDGDEIGDADAATADAAWVRKRLRRSVLVELIGAVLILGLTSTLVQTTPARAALEQTASRQDQPYSATLTTKLYSLQVQIEPSTVGANTVHLYAFAPDGSPVSVKEWTATAALPAKGIEPVALPTLPITDSHAVAQAQLPAAGTWELRFTLRTTDIDAATVVARVPVS